MLIASPLSFVSSSDGVPAGTSALVNALSGASCAGLALPSIVSSVGNKMLLFLDNKEDGDDAVPVPSRSDLHNLQPALQFIDMLACVKNNLCCLSISG